MRKYREALEDANEAINLSVNNQEKGRLYGWRSVVQLALRNPYGAIRDCSEAIRLGRTQGIVYEFRAQGYLMAGLWDNAIADASTASNGY